MKTTDADFFIPKASVGFFVYASRHLDKVTTGNWQASFDDDGNIDGITFIGDVFNYDDSLFKAIAPVVADGSFIIVKGEKLSKSWFFKNGAAIYTEFDDAK